MTNHALVIKTVKEDGEIHTFPILSLADIIKWRQLPGTFIGTAQKPPITLPKEVKK
jgi:hypothetical protein